MENYLIYPGQKLDKRMFGHPYTYTDGNYVYSAVLGILRNDKIVPLQGPYNPKNGDKVIGVVSDEKFNYYSVYINTPFEGTLSTRDCPTEYYIGDILECEVDSVDEVGQVKLKNPTRLSSGSLTTIPPVKVPRVIGKKMSMINLIKEKTGCDIKVGKNGVVWVSDCPNRGIVIKAIHKIIREAHLSGLTSKIEELLEEEIRKKQR